MAADAGTSDVDRGQRRATFSRSGSRETKRALVRSAVALWRVQGFDDTTVADICRAAGVSKGLFYFYFQRKEDILYELGAQETESLIRQAHVRMAAGGDLLDVVRTVVTALDRSMRRNPPELVIESIVEGYRRQRIDSGTAVRPDRSLLVFAELFERAVADGTLPASVDPLWLARLAQTLLSEGSRQWAAGRYEDRSMVDEVTRQIETVIVGAVQLAEPAQVTERRARRPSRSVGR